MNWETENKSKRRKVATDSETDKIPGPSNIPKGNEKTDFKNPKSNKKLKKGEISNKCSKLYEQLRKSSCSNKNKLCIIDVLLKLLKGKLNQVVYNHEMSRVVQTMLKYGTSEQKTSIVKEIIRSASSLCGKKYSIHVVKAILVHCSSPIRKELISVIMMDALRLLTNEVSAHLINDIYNNYTDLNQKKDFRKYIYGKTFKIMTSCKSLSSLMKHSPEVAPIILSSTKNNLLKLLQKEWNFHFPVVTAVLNDYLRVCSHEEQEEFHQFLKRHVFGLISTNHGSSVAMAILCRSTVKEKKTMLKQIQDRVLEIATTKRSRFLLALFDCVDDTVLLDKIVLSKIKTNLRELMQNSNGRRIISYIFLHRDKSLFSPKEVKNIMKVDGSEHTKKSHEQRFKEIRMYCVGSILDSIKEMPDIWTLNIPAAKITASVFEFSSTIGKRKNKQVSDAFRSICKMVVYNSGQYTEEESNEILIEFNSIHLLIKKLIQGDNIRAANELDTFSHSLLELLNNEIIQRWIQTNRGCFCFVWLLELGLDSVTDAVLEFFSNTTTKKIFKKQKFDGAILLNNKIVQLR